MKAQEYLEKNYKNVLISYGDPYKTKEEVKVLRFRESKLWGELDLRNFSNLVRLDCLDNKIDNIDLSNNHKLTELDCQENELYKLDLSNNPNLTRLCCNLNKKLSTLILNNNDKLELVYVSGCRIKANLDIFSRLTELQTLSLGEVYDYVSQNDFFGSLESLKNCTKLVTISIHNQKNITEGLEYLPLEKLRVFKCHNTIFQDMLRPYDYDIKAWKLVNYPKMLVVNKQELIKLLDQKIELSQKELNKIEIIDIHFVEERKRKAKRAIRLKSKIEILQWKKNNLDNKPDLVKRNASKEISFSSQNEEVASEEDFEKIFTNLKIHCMKLGNDKNEKKCVMCKEFKNVDEFSSSYNGVFCKFCWKKNSNKNLSEFYDNVDLRSFYKTYPNALPTEEMEEYFGNRSPSPINFEKLIGNIEQQLKMNRAVGGEQEDINRLENKKSELLSYKTDYVSKIQVSPQRKY